MRMPVKCKTLVSKHFFGFLVVGESESSSAMFRFVVKYFSVTVHVLFLVGLPSQMSWGTFFFHRGSVLGMVAPPKRILHQTHIDFCRGSIVRLLVWSFSPNTCSKDLGAGIGDSQTSVSHRAQCAGIKVTC